jgi:DNA-binding protein H-NS
MLQCAALNGVQIVACPPALLPHGFRRLPVESNDLKSMSSDELWGLYEEVAATLAGKIAAEKARLMERLRKLESVALVSSMGTMRRPYPRALPKYQNPKNPAETWSGRSKQPRWKRRRFERATRN